MSHAQPHGSHGAGRKGPPAHVKWTVIVFAILALAAIVAYVLSNDESVQPVEVAPPNAAPE